MEEGTSASALGADVLTLSLALTGLCRTRHGGMQDQHSLDRDGTGAQVNVR